MISDKTDLLLNKDLARAAIAGGKFLGGGGGGSAEEGLNLALKALELGKLRLVSLSKLEADTMVVTSSAVGAPAAKEKMVTPQNSIEAFELYKQITGEDPAGVITSENGGSSSVNGWILAAIAGIPIIDAPCNGRAHPTAKMGSMGLNHDPEYKTWQVAVGGNPELNKNLKLSVYGTLTSTSNMIRKAAVEAGGLVKVIRNGVQASYLRDNSAVGAISQAIEIGKIILNNQGDVVLLLNSLQKLIDLEVLVQGKIKDLKLITEGGFDVGKFKVSGCPDFEVTFWNEFMTVEQEKRRLASFPDLILVMNIKGKIRTSAELVEGEEVFLLSMPKSELKLGAGMYDRQLYAEVEEVINKDLILYHF